jgi:hypothetical protein
VHFDIGLKKSTTTSRALSEMADEIEKDFDSKKEYERYVRRTAKNFSGNFITSTAKIGNP